MSEQLTDEQWLEQSYAMYVESYDRELDTIPPLTFEDWKKAYATASLDDKRAYYGVDSAS